MRITKVVLAFFSIGFLAGSFERAAGLADAERPRRINDRAAPVAPSAGIVTASLGSLGELPEELPPRPLNGAGQSPDPTPTALPELTTVPPLNPDLRRHALRAKRMMSEPDPLAMSKLPGGKWMSLPSAEPWDLAPTPDADWGRTDAREFITEFIMPFERGRVTSLFNQGRRHPAIDLAGALGSSVHATTRKQRVTFAGWRGGYGNAVITRDDLGRTHLYGHLQRVLARVGSMLDQGQKLGALGSTGRSTGPHVHYEVRTKAGRHINPVTLLFPGRRVGRGFAWNGSRSVTRVVAQAQPRPR